MQPEIQLPSFGASLSLYSARAVRAFSMLFSAIAGGVMTAQNLKDIGVETEIQQMEWGAYVALSGKNEHDIGFSASTFLICAEAPV